MSDSGPARIARLTEEAMTEPMSREDALSIMPWVSEEKREVLERLRDLAKSRPIDLGGGVMVARLEQVGFEHDVECDEYPRVSQSDEYCSCPNSAVFVIRTDQPAAEEPAP